MPRPTENEAGLTAPRPEVFLRGLDLDGDLRACLVAFPRCDAAAGRPGGRWVRAFSLFRSFLYDLRPGY